MLRPYRPRLPARAVLRGRITLRPYRILIDPHNIYCVPSYGRYVMRPFPVGALHATPSPQGACRCDYLKNGRRACLILLYPLVARIAVRVGPLVARTGRPPLGPLVARMGRPPLGPRTAVCP